MNKGRRRRGRRRIASPILATTLLTAAAAAAVPGLTRVPIREVKIHGAFERVEKQDIQALVTPYLSWGWVRLPVNRLRGQLEALRWVASAKVRREWPLNLSIDISEHRPLARWGDQAMLNQAGAIFEPGDSMRGDLPMLRGPEGSQERVLDRYREFSTQLRQQSLALDAVTLDARGGWTLQLRQGMQLRLGSDLVQRRFERALMALDRLPRAAGQEIAYIDLRYPNGFAVAWRPSGANQRQQGGISP